MTQNFSNQTMSTRSNISIDSRYLKEPIIDKDIFINSFRKTVGNSVDNFDFSLLDYKLIKDTIDMFGIFPEKNRFYFCKFLL